MQIQTNYRSSCSRATEWLFYRFWEINRKTTALEPYFSTVTDLATSLKQNPTRSIFVKTFQNFQNRYFLCNTAKRLLLNLYTILIVAAPFFLPYLYVGTCMLSSYFLQKQPPRGVPMKMCSENIQQIYRRTPMPKCDFNKVAKQLYRNHTLAWVSSCKFAAYFQNTFSRNIAG